jgi:hypothetical protein
MCFGITISTLVDPLYCLEESKNVLSCSVKGNSWFSSKKKLNKASFALWNVGFFVSVSCVFSI